MQKPYSDFDSQVDITEPPRSPGPDTNRVVKAITFVLRELHIIQKLDVTADEAHKAWEVAKRIEARDVRAKAAAAAAYKMDVKEKDL